MNSCGVSFKRNLIVDGSFSPNQDTLISRAREEAGKFHHRFSAGRGSFFQKTTTAIG